MDQASNRWRALRHVLRTAPCAPAVGRAQGGTFDGSVGRHVVSPGPMLPRRVPAPSTLHVGGGLLLDAQWRHAHEGRVRRFQSVSSNGGRRAW